MSFAGQEASARTRHAKRVAALLAFAAFAGAVIAILPRARLAKAPGRVADFDDGPGLVITQANANASASARTASDESTAARERDERAAFLAFASAAPEARQQVIDAVSYAAARFEARLSPIGTDFDDGDPVTQLRATLATYATTFNAAYALERGRWQSDDLEVRPVASCERTSLMANERCIPLWTREGEPSGDSGDDENDGRGRFLAWPATSAAVFEISEADKHAVLLALRRRAHDSDSSIGLVLEARDVALHAVPEHSALEEAAERLGTAMVASDRTVDERLHALASRPASRSMMPWLSLSERAIVVIPRLSALPRRAQLLSELESAIAGHKARWVHRP